MMEKEKTIITEEDHLEEVWFKQAKEQTLETLPDFINHVMNDYYHDYGTVCHAISACAIAAAYAADNSDSGGITGFQAGCIMWDFIHQWMYSGNKCGMRIVDYDNMLYPQYGYKYEKTISSGTWQSIQKEAKKNLDDYHSGVDHCVAQPVLDHWQSIVDGEIPFGYTISDE